MDNLQEKYLELFNHLLALYPNNVEMVNEQIIVHQIDNLFNYDETEFYNVDIESFKLSKIVKSFSELFYCEWATYNSQIVSINNF